LNGLCSKALFLNGRHCERSEALIVPMSGVGSRLLRRCAPRNDGSL
jgi:hypothetical protein